MSRCFVGFELAEPTRAMLRRRLEPLHSHLRDELGWKVVLVPPENWHCTILFFDSLGSGERKILWEGITQWCNEGLWKTLKFDWQNFSLWPSAKRPNLMVLQAAEYMAAVDWPLSRALEQAPFNQAKIAHLRRYRPHITVMRFKRGRTQNLAADWARVQEMLPPFNPAEITLAEVSLFLSQGGRIYPREYRMMLNSRKATSLGPK